MGFRGSGVEGRALKSAQGRRASGLPGWRGRRSQSRAPLKGYYEGSCKGSM